MYFSVQRHCSHLTSKLSTLRQSKVNTSSRRLPHVTNQKALHSSHIHTHTQPSTFDCWTNTHPSPLKNIQSHLIPREGSKREKEVKRNEIEEHALNSDLLSSLGWQRSHMLLTQSIQVQVPPPFPESSSTMPSPSAQSKDRLTSCLPLTLRYPPPPPLSGKLPMQTGWWGRLQRKRQREICMNVGGGD